MRVKQVFAHYEGADQVKPSFKYCPFCGTPLTLVESNHQLRPTCSNCGYIQFKNPAPAVSILIVHGDHVLIGKRGHHPGKGTWSLPSGYIDYGEDFLSTAVRESKEETGLDVEVCAIINVISSFISPQFHFIGIYLLAKVIGGQLVAGDDLEAIEWFPINGPLPEMGFEEDIAIVEMFRKGITRLPVDPAYASQAQQEQ